MSKALGIIESLGLTTAVTALDAALKAADVSLVGVEKIIGVGKAVGVNIIIAGEVAAVRASVDAGVVAGNRIGTVFSSHVIPRPHDDVEILIAKFAKNLKNKEPLKELINEEVKNVMKNKK